MAAGERVNLPASIIFIAFFSLVCTYLLIVLTYQLCCKNVCNSKKQKIINQKPKSKAVFLSNFLIILCALISTMCVWSDLIRHVWCLLFIDDQDLYSFPINNIFCFADFLYFLGSCVFYIIAIYRLQVTFAGSKYAITKSLSLTVYILTAVIFVCGVYYSIIVALDKNEYDDWWLVRDGPALVITCVIDFVLNCWLLLIFVFKLKQILQLRYNVDPTVYSSLIKNKSDGSQPHEILQLMTRHTLLFGIAIGTNQIWSVSVLLQLYLNVNLILSNFCFRAVENTANCMVLFLTFKANERCYTCLCKICHKKIQKCFLKSLKKKDSINPVSNTCEKKNRHSVKPSVDIL